MELNKVYNENCLDTMARMGDNFIDLTVTSPPYDKLRDYKGYSFDFESIAKELYRVTKNGGVVVWVVGDSTVNGSETGSSFKQALYFKEIGFNLHDTMIYMKDGMAFPDANRYYNVFEYMFILSKGDLKKFNPISDRKNKYAGQTKHGKERNKDGTMRDPSCLGRIMKLFGVRFNIWSYSTGKGNSTKDDIAFEHPAIFPEKLAADHIISWSNEDDIVYDPMSGSGTTCKMALLLKRNYIGSEVSEEYCRIIEARLNIIKNQGQLF